jgi:hypothetical protein
VTSKRSNDAGSVGRRIPVGMVLLAIAAVGLLPLGVATAVGALAENAESDTTDRQAADDGQHEASLNTNRQQIGRGDSAFGPYIMYASTGPEGTCVEIELPQTDPPGTRSFHSDCSREGDQPVNSAEVGDGYRTLVFGLVPAGTARVELDRGTSGDLVATVRGGHRGERWKFFVASTPEPYIAGTIRAVDADGQQIATEWLPPAEFIDPAFRGSHPPAGGS